MTSFKRDLQTYFDQDIAVKAYPTVLLVNSPMADPEYMETYQIKAGENGRLVSTYSYSNDDLREMTALYQLYDICDNASFLRYVLRYLQWDHDIDATDYLHALLRRLREEPERFSTMAWTQAERPLSLGLTFDTHAMFYNEIARFTMDMYHIAPGDALDTALEVNSAVIPGGGSCHNITLELAHDFAAYFFDHITTASVERPLGDYAPGTLTISDPHNLSQNARGDLWSYDNHQVFWELESVLSRHRSQPNLFVQRLQA